MVNLAGGATPSTSLAVPGARLADFEPQGLGSFHSRFRRVLAAIDGRRQSEIKSLLEREEQVARASDRGANALAYRVSLLVLRDYVASGYYPLIIDGRCLLAPVFESTALTPAKRRVALQRTYESARNRAIQDRDQVGWIGRAAAALAELPDYDAGAVIGALAEESPEVRLEQVASSKSIIDPRGLWRSVRATWSMGPEMSAPGREVAILASDRRFPKVPLGIAQFRNVVPEIQARDLWLGISTGSDEKAAGFVHRLGDDPEVARHRLKQTESVLQALLDHVNFDGLTGIERDDIDLGGLAAIIRMAQEHYQDERRADAEGAYRHLATVKRAETASELWRGLAVLRAAQKSEDPAGLLRQTPRLRRDLDAGLRKLWHYHMGFVAIEMSICGAAPPFGPMRVGKLMAALAGSAEVVASWGVDRPLGDIATTVYDADVRSAVPNPGPLVIFTSGLYPGHSAQYNRAESGNTRWQKIGETTGFGSFHIGVDTTRVMSDFNQAIDGYNRITRTFGEGSGARFRSVGRALGRLGLPDLRRHETRRPLYALPLVDSPGDVILGWQDGVTVTRPTAQELASQWWTRWIGPRGAELAARAAVAPDLPGVLGRITADLNV